jgi:hypothetical protein
LAINVDVQGKVKEKKLRNRDKGEVLNGLCKKVDKIKPIGGTPNGEHTCRSNRTKNPNSAKLNDFLWETKL